LPNESGLAYGMRERRGRGWAVRLSVWMP
jgi:hypothetical protein